MKPTREQIVRWLRQGERDLEIAQRNLDIGLYDVCVLFCEQAVEKHLKALYIHANRAEPPKTHKIVELARQLGASRDLYELLHLLEIDYLASRYPDFPTTVSYEDYDEEVARERLAIAQRVVKWVHQQLEQDDET